MDVGEWQRGIGLVPYTQAFRDNNIRSISRSESMIVATRSPSARIPTWRRAGDRTRRGRDSGQHSTAGRALSGRNCPIAETCGIFWLGSHDFPRRQTHLTVAGVLARVGSGH
jgi:hypothetical protein